MKLYILILTVLFSLNLFAQKTISVELLSEDKLPKEFRFKGKIKTAVRFIDKLGDNIVITTETGIYPTTNLSSQYGSDVSSDAEIYAYHFLIKNDSLIQLWKVYDFISDCPVDIEATFLKNTFQVTDLNNDGVAEIWLMYRKVCHGDVSPFDMKIIMYQGRQKFAIRGQNKVYVSTDKNGKEEYAGGDYKYDQAFAEQKDFLEFAKKMWNENMMYKWGED